MSERSATARDTYSFLLTPGSHGPLHVRFEPAGPEYDIGPGDHLRISVQSPSDDPIEVTAGTNWATVWGAPTAIIRATTSTGKELGFLM